MKIRWEEAKDCDMQNCEPVYKDKVGREETKIAKCRFEACTEITWEKAKYAGCTTEVFSVTWMLNTDLKHMRVTARGE